MNTERMKAALNEFALSLSDTPKWVGLMKHEGDFLVEIGEFRFYEDLLLSKEEVVRKTQSTALRTRDMLEDMHHGNLQLSLHMAGAGFYIVVNLIDTWLLGISYHGPDEGCCSSIDALLESIMANFQMIRDEL
jgi:hypothetical protein